MNISFLLKILIVASAGVFCLGQNDTFADFNDYRDYWTNRLEVFNENRLLRNWKTSAEHGLTPDCNRDFYQYLVMLSNNTAWATRIKDASGQYNSGLFWGNYYWLGSARECKNLDDRNRNYHPDQLSSTSTIDPEFIITYEKRTIYKNNPYDKFTNPPFSLMFSTVLFRLNLTDKQTRDIFYITQGLCLPRSCNVQDIRQIFKIDQSNLGPNIQIIQIRQLTGSYSIWNDKIFLILSLITLILISLVTIGTMVDIRNSRTLIIKKKSIQAHIAIQLLSAFSLKSNIKKITSYQIGDDTLAPIHGLRLLSFIWVVLVHTCLIVFQMSDNKTYRNEIENDVLYQTISNATFSVDTFFLISGALVSFLFYRTVGKYTTKQLIHTNGIKAQVLMYLSMIVYRFIRLTPPYAVVIALAAITTKHQISNMVIQLPNMDHINCETYWWRNILYINTFFSSKEMCMIWSWYLSNDTQFYAIGIIVLLISVKYKTLAGTIVAGLLLTAWITTALVTIATEYIPITADPFSHYDEIYDKPWTRLGPYFIGMVTGYILYKTNCKIEITRGVSASGWILAIGTILGVLYGIYYVELDIYTAAAYVSLSHTFWALAMAWILIACVSGHGGWLKSVLCWKYLYPFSRLSYCAYLIHPVVIKNTLLNVESPVHISKEVMLVYFLGFLVLSFAAAFVLSLLFEAPIVSLLHFAHPIKVTNNKGEDHHKPSLTKI